MEQVLTIVTVAGALATLGCLIFIVTRYQTLAGRRRHPGLITVQQLGLVEKDLQELMRVIVVADHIEKPTDSLADAIESNFRRGVSYLFLVSNSKADSEVNGYFLLFEALARIAASRSKSDVAVRNLVDIKRLPYDWLDYPYIFYQCWSHGDDEPRRTIAFRGNQRIEGIAEMYEQVPPAMASAIAIAVLAGSPESIRERVHLSPAEFERPLKRKRLRVVKAGDYDQFNKLNDL